MTFVSDALGLILGALITIVHSGFGWAIYMTLVLAILAIVGYMLRSVR